MLVYLHILVVSSLSRGSCPLTFFFDASQFNPLSGVAATASLGVDQWLMVAKC